MMTTFLHKLMLTCEKASWFIEKNSQDRLTLWERMRLQTHLIVCRFCRLFNQQSRFIDKQLHHLINDPADLSSGPVLDDASKARLEKTVQQQLEIL